MRVMVFPCGSEIGLEVHRSLHGVRHFSLVGVSSVPDHGRFVYKHYVEGFPFHSDPQFFGELQDFVLKENIDAIFPAMDSVANTLKRAENELRVRVVGSSPEATAIAASKILTHDILKEHVPVPKRYSSEHEIDLWPVFIKPEHGYGGRGAAVAGDFREVETLIARAAPETVGIFENLPGQEWTIDCFSDRYGALRFSEARKRARISNGISMSTFPCVEFKEQFKRTAETINEVLQPRGAWFFQMKEDVNGEPRLLEVATRLGGSSGVFRCRGINFAAMSLYDAFNMDIEIIDNRYHIELDRALTNRYKVSLKYEHIFVDLDDCLLISESLNVPLVSFLYSALSNGKEITLLTRHAYPLEETLRRHRISALFDRIVHITDRSIPKSAHIDRSDSIFIDDSFAERQDVHNVHGIPVFSPDMVEALMPSPYSNV